MEKRSESKNMGSSGECGTELPRPSMLRLVSRAFQAWKERPKPAAQPRMRTRDKALIGSDFPDDMIEVDGEIVQWGGRGVAVAIADILRRLGAEASEPIDEGDHGWGLDIDYKDRNPWCLIQDGGGHFYFWIDDRWGRDRPEYVELLVGLNEGLHRDSRFHDIRWYRRHDINFGGPDSSSPVE